MNSTPQLLDRDHRAVAPGAQLGPGDLRLEAAAWAAVGADHQRVLAHAALDQIRRLVSGPVAGYGPFVRNIWAHIHQALENFRAGRFWISISDRVREARLLPSEQPPLAYHLCNDHVADRRLATAVRFEAAL